MIRIFRFKKNDLNPSGGKQIEYSISDVKDFFKFSSNEVAIDFKFHSLLPNNLFNGYKFKSTFKLSPARGDYKCYGNLDGSPNLKDFFLEKLHLSAEENLNDSYALKKLSDTSYIITYIPAGLPFSEVANFLYSNNTLVAKENIDSEESSVKSSIKALSKIQNSSLPTLTAVRTKPFMLLAGISGTGKSRIVRKLAQATVPEYLQWLYEGACTWAPKNFSDVRWDLSRPANFELIQVKPNWHNSMDVVGYLSNIPTPHYVFTPFINFIVRAMCHPKVPFFLCLDEMNLAPVEEYFAEFLSAIESRSKSNGEYTTDPIIPPFKTFGKTRDEQAEDHHIGKEMLATLSQIIDHELTEKPKTDVPQGTSREIPSDSELNQSVKKHLWEKGVTLPENLIIIGTVNMDETTFSFSRKVLDRAMSMEMNKVDYSSFLTGNTDDDIKAIADHYKVDEDSTGEVNELNKLLVDRHIEAKEVVPTLQEEARFVIDYLETINKLLDGTPFKLGYRVANEAIIYLQSTKDFGMDDKEAAMDRFTLMKILSRIEGDESKLKLTESDKARVEACGIDFGKLSEYRCGATILSAMREIIADKLSSQAEAPQPPKAGELEEGGEATHLESIKKLDAMMAQLDRDHFVSYWS